MAYYCGYLLVAWPWIWTFFYLGTPGVFCANLEAGYHGYHYCMLCYYGGESVPLCLGSRQWVVVVRNTVNIGNAEREAWMLYAFNFTLGIFGAYFDSWLCHHGVDNTTSFSPRKWSYLTYPISVLCAAFSAYCG